jgi:signal transduction histidine kinase
VSLLRGLPTRYPRMGIVRTVATLPARQVDVAGATEVAVAAERQRIAGVLHDDVSSLLFAIAAGVQRAELLHADDARELGRALSQVGRQVLEVSDRVRTVLRSCSPVEPSETVPAAVQRDLDDAAARSGLDTHLVLRGRARDLGHDAERVVLNCLRQALFNVERHAAADLVVVTLEYVPGRVELVVQDDGRGLPTGFVPTAVPVDGGRWGYASMLRQVEQLGGTLTVAGAEDGGTRLRVRLPA